MHEYDAALKITLQHVDVAIRDLVGSAVTRWHNIEFPKIESRRADLLGETETGELAHIELQSTNDEDMPIRMLNYYIHVRKKFGRYPQQVVLYVGDEPPRMETELRGPALDYSYRLIDVRDLDGERLLKSERVDDNIIAMLTRLSDRRLAAQLVLQTDRGLGVARPGGSF
jgi:predicted transposase YdaD